MGINSFSRQTINVKRLPPAIVEKWGREVLDEGFVPFPKRLLRCMHQIFTGQDAAVELAVVLAVVDFKRPNLTRNPSSEYLAFLAGLPEKQFLEVLSALKEKGLLTWEESREELDIDLKGLFNKIEGLTA